MPNPKPVVTMEKHNGKQWVYLDGIRYGRIWPGKPSLVHLDVSCLVEDVRAIADFLDQLEGADRLSQVTE